MDYLIMAQILYKSEEWKWVVTKVSFWVAHLLAK